MVVLHFFASLALSFASYVGAAVVEYPVLPAVPANAAKIDAAPVGAS